MKKSKLAFIIVLALLPILTAMSALQSQSPEKIPVPEKKYFATFVDQTDIMTDCRNISIDGETFLEGKRGNGTNTISFEIIAEVSFLLEGEKLTGTVKLRDGNAIQLSLNKNQRAYGYTKYGTYQIKLSELKQMILSK